MFLVRFFKGFGPLLFGMASDVLAGQNAVPPETAGTEQAMTDILDIKAPMIFGLDPALVRYAGGALAAAVLIVLLIVAWRYWRRKRSKIIEPEVEVQVPPETLAYGRLDTLAGQGDLDGKPFYFKLSAILRDYIQGRFEIAAPEMTTEELLPHLARLGLSEDSHRSLRRFLNYSDGVKFADLAADTLQRQKDLDFVRRLVRVTTPAVEETADVREPAKDLVPVRE